MRPSLRCLRGNVNNNQRLLELLLPACKTVESSKQELRWIQNELPQTKWLDACLERSKFVPLQYILGTQPFGDLEIKCKRNVLIPRWETEEWTVKLIRRMEKLESLRVLDVCTGTGCIPLLMGHKLTSSFIKGLDISKDAITLARENKEHNDVSNVEFNYGDVFDKDLVGMDKFDIITSNPPYISENDYTNGETEKSVMIHEPKLALVGGTEFYEALVHNVLIPSQAEGFVFELGDLEQARFTQRLLENKNWNTKIYIDSNEKIRCVYGWIKNSRMQVLDELS